MPDSLNAAPKKIVFVSNSAWSVYNFRIDVIRHFIAQAFHVIVIAPDDGYSEKLVQEGCRYIALRFDNKTVNPFNDYRLYRRLYKLYRSIAPDFIFHYVAKPNIYGSLAAGAEGIPSVAVVTGLGYPFARKNLLSRIVKLLYHKALKHAREVWFLNNEDARVFVNEKIVDITKIKILPGEGVNTDHFAPRRLPDNQSFRFVMSTRLLKSKGVSLYADAARILRKKQYAATFELMGFYEHTHPDSIMDEDIKRWEQEGLVRYLGFVEDVRPYLSQADCFVFPSFYNEGVPRCLMEAASMELPIITSLNRGCKEVVLNNSNGFIVNINDPFDLADKMERMIHLAAEERLRMGKNGRQLVLKKFGMAKIIQEYSNTLISAFETPRQR